MSVLPTGYATETKNSIIAMGLTIHNAPVELREKLAVPEAEWPRAIEELCSYPHIEEAAVLSTCNRMELYVVAVSWHRGVREVEEWLSRSSGVPLEDLRPYLFLLRDRDATHHLLRVSGGLDSLVMGEGQILAQVRQVYKVGQNTQVRIRAAAGGRIRLRLLGFCLCRQHQATPRERHMLCMSTYGLCRLLRLGCAC